MPGDFGVRQLVALQPSFKLTDLEVTRVHAPRGRVKPAFATAPVKLTVVHTVSIRVDFSELQTVYMQGPSADYRLPRLHRRQTHVVPLGWLQTGGGYTVTACDIRIIRSGGASHKFENNI